MDAGMHFIDSVYTAQLATGAGSTYKQLFSVLGVKKPDKLAIARYILQLHTDTAASSITEEQRSRHLAFLADNSKLLKEDSSLLDQARGAVHLQDSNGAYQPAKRLWFPPEGEAADLQPDLTDSGMAFIHQRYMELFSKSSSSRQQQLMQLLEMLEVDHPSVSDTVTHLVDLHVSDSKAVSEQQRHRHLAYWADNIKPLKDTSGLLAMLQESLRLKDASGIFRPAGELVFPLGPEASILQPSMDAAGMHFLHSSYTEAASGSTGSSSSNKTSRMQLQAASCMQHLLYELGVSDPDADKIATRILMLYQAGTATTSSSSSSTDSVSHVSFDQHMAHIQFLYRSWSQLKRSVQDDVHKQLQLQLLGGGSRTARASEATGESQAVYLLPPDGSIESQMLPTLQNGGALFLDPDYSAAAAGLQSRAVWRDLEQWFVAALGVRRLVHEDAVGFILTAHSSSSYRLDAACSQQDVIKQGLYVAAVSHRLLSKDLKSEAKTIQALAKEQMQVVVHPSAPNALGSSSSSNASEDAAEAEDAAGGNDTAGRNYRCQTATQGVLYWPAVGGQHSSWQLQEVLLPSEVVYLHPDYITALQQWNQDSDGGELQLTASGLQRFFTQGLGLRVTPMPGSTALQAAVESGDRWRPMLLMLSEIWSKYKAAEQQQQLQQQLRDMMVEASCGPRPLHQCFVPTQALPTNLVALLTQLQLPVLQLPAQCDWSFLQQLGVSTELNWPTLHKALQQLSGGGMLTGSDADLAAMGCLYEQVSAQVLLSGDVAPEVRTCFEKQPLLFVRVLRQQDWAPFWFTCKDVMWSGNRRVFADVIFIALMYKDLETFFCKYLGVRSTTVDDLKGALERMSTRSVSSDTPDIYLDIIKQLAESASSLSWLPELLDQPVLLTRTPAAAESDASHQLRFVSAAAGSAPYLPDRQQLVDLFGAHCSLLEVPPEELPGLQPLLQLLQPPLRSLSSSLQRSITYQDRNAEAHPDSRLTLLLQDVVKLAARCVYTKQPQHYMQLLNNGQLQQLVDMQASSVPGLVETLALKAADGTVIHTVQQPAGALVSDKDTSADPLTSDNDGEAAPPLKVMLVNTSIASGGQRRAIATNLAELLCSSSSSAMLEPLTQLIKLLLGHISSGEPEEAETELEERGVTQIPRDKRLWLLPGEAAAAASSGVAGSAGPAQTKKQVWADDTSDDAEDFADTGDSIEHRMQQLAAAQERSRRTAEQQARAHSAAQQEYPEGLELPTTEAETTAAATAAEVHLSSGFFASRAADTGAARADEHADAGSSPTQPGDFPDSGLAALCGDMYTADGASGSNDDLGVARPTTPRVSGPSYSSSSSSRAGGSSWASGQGRYRASGYSSSSTQSTRRASQPQGRPLRLTDKGTFTYADPTRGAAGAAGAAEEASFRSRNAGSPPARDVPDAMQNNDNWAAMIQEALSAGQATVSNPGSFPQSYDSMSTSMAPLPSAPGFGPAGDDVSLKQPGQGIGRVTRITEVHQVYQSITEATFMDFVSDDNDSSSSGGGSSSSGSGRSFYTGTSRGFSGRSGNMGFSGRTSNMDHAALTGAAGEVFLFSWLSQQLPGFTQDNWCSSNRVHLPGDKQQLQPPLKEPSFDFMYEDTNGVLSGEPGTLCYIECKATASDLRGSSLVPMPITPAEWALAQQVHRERLAGQQVQYILIRVDRVGKPGGPRVVAVLRDPVQLLCEGKLSITGWDLSINKYPLSIQ